MSKQIKIGFDKNTSRPVSTDQILVDVRGNPLTDSSGRPLFTETTRTPTAFFAEKNSTSIQVNNEATPVVRAGGSIAIEERFAETSEVSSSLLGIPRAERQQTLLADVSIYGQDENTWEFFRNPNPFQPVEWATRRNKTFGRRYNPRLKEHPEEQALALEVFPTPYTFPFGPLWGSRRFNQVRFGDYIRFIRLGNALYDFFAEQPNNLPEFAKKHFLLPGMATIQGNDVIYNDDFELALESIEQWTISWMDIREGNRLDNPLPSFLGTKITSGFINRILKDQRNIIDFNFSETQPGYSSSSYRYCQLQSKEAFRYQPGAISGFTFGVKLNSDPARLENVLEWGAANETDQLMFQVRGSQFNIVRRSTVRLTRENLELNGFTIEDQIPVEAPNPFERADNSTTTTDFGLPPDQNKPQLWELTIQSDDFNGDPLDGSGPSGYTISFNEVTMYKIEYSWYGAIGAKFYAYIPVSNDETRWVLIHTLVIENTLNEPSLRNPFMHFRYVIYVNDTSALREPMFLYKYGASYYIDGSDEGTFTYNSYNIPIEKSITSINSTPILGFLPKEEILNRDGIGNSNQKNFYIEKLSASSDKNTRIDILECEGCPGGHGHFYATSLQNGQKGLVDEFRITPAGNLEFVDDAQGTKVFTSADNDKKIIAPGVFSSYVFFKNTPDLEIRRRVGNNRVNNKPDEPIEENTLIFVNGEDTNLLGHQFTGRLTGYDDIIASTTVITKPKIKVQFLNPVRRDGQHFAEFRIGITTKKPELITPEGEEEEVLLFDNAPLNIEDEIFGEFAQFDPSRNVRGVEVGEQDPRAGNLMQQDFRIGRPRGSSSGDCSELTFEIEDVSIFNGASYTTTDPSGELEGSNFITFTSRPQITDFIGGGIGVFDGNRFVDSGVVFTSNIVSFTEEETGDQRFVVEISDDITDPNVTGVQNVDITEFGIAVRRVTCFGRFTNESKIFPFGSREYFLFIAMRDNARINNIVVKEFDEVSSFSHTPIWIKDDNSNIDVIQIQNAAPPSSVFDKLPLSNEYIGTDGLFNMGGITNTGDLPANFAEKNRLDSVQFDDQLSLPLRPSSLKTSLYISANKTETIDMTHIFDTDKFKVSKGTFNNKYLHISSIVTDSGETGTTQINISGKEQ